MSLLMTVRVALAALGRNKTRTALTLLGMVIGVAAVIAIVAIGNGAQESIEERIQSAGTNLIYVNAGSWNSHGVHMGQGASSRLTAEDAAAIRALPGVQYVCPTVSTRAQLIAAGTNWGTRVQGTGAELPEIRSWTMESGRYFEPYDIEGARKVVVLGSVVRDELFGEGVDPTGRIVRVGTQAMQVVGVLASKGQAAGGDDQDDGVFVPYTTAQKKLLGVQYVNNIMVSAASPDQVAPVSDAITALMRARHAILADEEDDFTVRTLEEIADMRSAAAETMTLLLAGIAAVSLLVGGIGIMNIMLVAVTERTREIGLRLAVGARSGDVLRQFLVEAITLSLLGGVIGIAAGAALAHGMTGFFGWPTAISPGAVMLAVGFAGGIGIFFGFYPARTAARLDPIDALRYE